MSDKVKLPKEVAEAIVRTKSKHYTWNNHDLCYIVLNRSGYCQYENDADITLIHKWSNANELIFAKALINGYEVEQTPEDKVRELFKNPGPFHNGIGETSTAYRDGVRETLDALEIEIEGINT